jgi:two-component system, OmpR family, response regulator
VRIAVLDDNPSIGEMLQHYLQLEGHTVVVYYSPSKFLPHIIEPTTASTPFDLMIVDLFLSEGISGGEVMHQVRKIFPDLPVILISAASAWEIEAAKRALPTVRVLRKPFNMASLLALIQELKHE